MKHSIGISQTRGVSGVEMLIGISLAALVLVFTTHAIVRYVNVGSDISDKTVALYLAEEQLELVRYVRDEAWTNISTLTNGTTYYIDIGPASISITSTPQPIGQYQRGFFVKDVYRNSDDDIVASTTPGSTADADTKYVTSFVTWGSSSSTVSLTSIVADIES